MSNDCSRQFYATFQHISHSNRHLHVLSTTRYVDSTWTFAHIVGLGIVAPLFVRVDLPYVSCVFQHRGTKLNSVSVCDTSQPGETRSMNFEDVEDRDGQFASTLMSNSIFSRRTSFLEYLAIIEDRSNENCRAHLSALHSFKSQRGLTASSL